LIADEDESGLNVARYLLARFYADRIDAIAQTEWSMSDEGYRLFLVIDREQKCDRTEEFQLEGGILWSDLR
jgi:hypothetical protein